MKRRIAVLILSRANYARIKSVLVAINESPSLELALIVGGSAVLEKYGECVEVIRSDGFQISAESSFIVEGDAAIKMAKSVGLGIIELTGIFSVLKPEVVLTVADRFETMATAIAATYMNIPLAHTQGGEVTGSLDESIRHAITKLAHLHFPATRKAAQNIKNLGERDSDIYLTGCPAIDLLIGVDENRLEGILSPNRGVGPTLDHRKPFILVVFHPVTTELCDVSHQTSELLNAVREINMQCIWLWPNIDAGSDRISQVLRKYRENGEDKSIHFYKNFSPEDYAVLLKTTSVIVGNSSSAIREGSFLGTPAVNIGNRQTNRERGLNICDVECDKNAILEAIRMQIKAKRYPKDELYGGGDAGVKIAKVLADHKFNIQKLLIQKQQLCR